MDIETELYGKSVIIEWQDHDLESWENYRVEGIDIYADWIKLAGERSDDGTPYLGGTIFVSLFEITSIMLRAPASDNGA